MIMAPMNCYAFSLRFSGALLASALCFLMQGLCIAQNPTPLERQAQKPVEGSQPAKTGAQRTDGRMLAVRRIPVG